MSDYLSFLLNAYCREHFTFLFVTHTTDEMALNLLEMTSSGSGTSKQTVMRFLWQRGIGHDSTAVESTSTADWQRTGGGTDNLFQMTLPLDLSLITRLLTVNVHIASYCDQELLTSHSHWMTMLATVHKLCGSFSIKLPLSKINTIIFITNI